VTRRNRRRTLEPGARDEARPSQSKGWRVAAIVATAVLPFALGACGSGGGADTSGGSGASSGSGTSASGASSTSPATTAETTNASPKGESGGSLTPPGTQLQPGSEATVGWVPPSTFKVSGAQRALELEVTVEAIEMGTLADFKNIELEPDQRQSTPYYVKVQLKALGGSEPPSEDEPAYAFTAIDDRGQEQGSVTFFGDFPRCEEKTMPKPFTDGKSYESCFTYLMPGGGSIQKVQWADGPSKANEVTPYFEDPIVWEAG
jgi:hypothetical protein